MYPVSMSMRREVNSSFSEEFRPCLVVVLSSFPLFWSNAALLYLSAFLVNVSAMDGRRDEVGVQGLIVSLEFRGCGALGRLVERCGC